MKEKRYHGISCKTRDTAAAAADDDDDDDDASCGVSSLEGST